MNFITKIETNLKLIILFILSVLLINQAGLDSYILQGFVLVLSLLLLLYIYKISNISYSLVLLIFFVFVLLAFVSVFWSIYSLRTIVESFELLFLFLILFFSHQISKKDFQYLIKALLLVGVAIAIIGFIQFILGQNRRIVSVLTNPNPYGLLMSVFFILSFGYFYLFNKNKYFSISVIFLTSVILSGSRGSYIALLIGGLLFLLVDDREEVLVKFKSLLKMGIVAIVLTFLLIKTRIIIASFLDVNTTFNNFLRVDSFASSSVVGRLEFWKVAWKLFLRKPLLGFGQGTYFSSYVLEYVGNQWFARFTHNHYLQVLSELGVTGFIVFMTFIFFTIKDSINNLYRKNIDKEKLIYFSAIVVFLVHIGIDFTWNYIGITAIVFLLIGQIINKKEIVIKKKKTISFVILGLVVLNFIVFLPIVLTHTLIKNYDDNPQQSINYMSMLNKYNYINPNLFLIESDWILDQNKTIENYSKSAKLLEKAVLLAPYDANFQLKLADDYQEMGNKEKARFYFEEASKNGLYFIKYKIRLQRFYDTINENKKGIEVLENALPLIEVNLKKTSGDKRFFAELNSFYIYDTLLNHYKDRNQEKYQEILKDYETFNENYLSVEK